MAKKKSRCGVNKSNKTACVEGKKCLSLLCNKQSKKQFIYGAISVPGW